jgi:hypothetical protein
MATLSPTRRWFAIIVFVGVVSLLLPTEAVQKMVELRTKAEARAGREMSYQELEYWRKFDAAIERGDSGVMVMNCLPTPKGMRARGPSGLCIEGSYRRPAFQTFPPRDTLNLYLLQANVSCYHWQAIEIYVSLLLSWTLIL